MSGIFSLAWSTWLLQAAAQPDTSVMKTIAVRSWWQALIDIEQAIVPLALIVLLVAIAFGVYKMGRGVQEVSKLVQASTGDLSNAAHSVRNVAEDIKGITGTVKVDVEAVGDTVRTLNDRVRGAMAQAEHRLRRFDALVEVAQEEVEDFVVSTAATMRGVRSGASVLRRSFLFARRNGLFGKRRRRRWRDRVPRARDTEGDERPRIRTRIADKT